MPKLTPEFDRIYIFGLQTSDATNFVEEHAAKLNIMQMEIRMCEDYSLSDIMILDLGKYGLGHVTKITIPTVKKYELCAMVSTANMIHENDNVSMR
jgi:hypothetical protein